MNKNEFLSALRAALSGLPDEGLEERIDFYSESIDDRMEEGLTEEEAVAALGSVDSIASQIISETPLVKIVKKKLSAKRAYKTWEIVLLAVGSPIWLALAISAIAVIVSLYAVLWAMIASVWAVFASLCASALGGIAGGAVLALTGSPMQGIALIGAALSCAGLAIFAFIGCKAATVESAVLTKKICYGIKNILLGKEKHYE